VTAAAYSFRAVALRHPWLASVLGQAGLAYLGPKLMAVSEGLVALFAAAGFPQPDSALDAVMSYVLGMSSTEAAWLGTVARSGQTEAEFVASLMPAAQQAAAGHEYLSRSYTAEPPADPAALRDAKFAAALEIILDGLALARTSAGTGG
jgi:hypothetical protein